MMRIIGGILDKSECEIVLNNSVEMSDAEKAPPTVSPTRHLIGGWLWRGECSFGWTETRGGQLLRSTVVLIYMLDLDQRALKAMKEANLNVKFNYVSTHVDIYDNEKVDKLTKESTNRTHKSARTDQVLMD